MKTAKRFKNGRSQAVRLPQCKGTPIGPYDLLMAGLALSRGMTLVTNNSREFSRIEGLRVENWAE